MAPFISLGGYLLAGLLAASLIAKRRSRSRDETLLEATALSKLVRNRRVLVLVWHALLVGEGGVAILLILAPPLIGGLVAASFFAGASLYLLVALKVAPERPCGCFGRSDTPVSPKTVVRALSLVLIGALYAFEASSPSRHLGGFQAWLGISVMLAVIAALSPEIEVSLAKLAQFRGARCLATSDPDPVAYKRMLARTRAWHALEPHLIGSEPTDKWREGCWYYVSYAALHDGVVATATFGLRLPPGRCLCHGVLRRGLIGQPLLALPAERIRWFRRGLRA